MTQTFRWWLASCLIFWVSGYLFAADLVKAKDGSGRYGYKDTPKLPWCDYLVHDADRPGPRRVEPGAQLACLLPAPTDATVLFDGQDVSKWEKMDWRVVDGCLEATTGSTISTRQKFGSFQLHLEWMGPVNFKGPWYDQGNNGVLLHGLYEIQIFDSFNEKIYADGVAGAIYGQTPPTVDVCRRPGEWQSFDIFFEAPQFKAGELTKAAFVTVLHNGVLIHLHQQIYGVTGHRILPKYDPAVSEGPVKLMGHGCPVRFRNIWIRPL
jgi:hypothetical protein